MDDGVLEWWEQFYPLVVRGVQALVDDHCVGGDLGGEFRVRRVTSDDLNALGNLARSREQFELGRDWLEEALAILKSGKFEIIVSDIEMPGMSGYQLAEAVRSDARRAGVTMIALSALASEAMIERGRRAGFDDFVAKFDRQGLIAALKQASLNWGEAA